MLKGRNCYAFPYCDGFIALILYIRETRSPQPIFYQNLSTTSLGKLQHIGCISQLQLQKYFVFLFLMFQPITLFSWYDCSQYTGWVSKPISFSINLSFLIFWLPSAHDIFLCPLHAVWDWRTCRQGQYLPASIHMYIYIHIYTHRHIFILRHVCHTCAYAQTFMYICMCNVFVYIYCTSRHMDIWISTRVGSWGGNTPWAPTLPCSEAGEKRENPFESPFSVPFCHRERFSARQAT